MFAPAWHGACRCSATAKQRSVTIPEFLLPSLMRPSILQQRQSFSTSRPNGSRVGAAPLALPEGVSLTIIEPPKAKSTIIKRITPLRKLQVTGPTGQLTIDMPHYMKLDLDPEGKKAILSVEDRTIRKQREMWGTTRAILQNHIMGVSEGHATILRLNGVGYRAFLEEKAQTKEPMYEGQKFLNLKLGYSHPIELGVPKGVKASTPQPTRILLEGAEKEVINQFAAEIRNWKKPEPYKGKGIFVNGETIRLKAKKVK